MLQFASYGSLDPNGRLIVTNDGTGKALDSSALHKMAKGLWGASASALVASHESRGRV